MRSVSTTFEVLDALAERQPVGVGELARVLDLPKSTVQRSLVVLHDSGWIRPWSTSGHTKWVLTVKPLTLAGYVLRGERLLREAAAPIMAELGARTEETIHLTVLDGDHVVLLDKVDSTQAVRTMSWIGGRVALNASASGLAMLANLPPSRAEALELIRYTDASLVERSHLTALLDEIRECGYAINVGMWRADVSAVAAAVLGPSGDPIAAVSISMPSYRLTEERRTEYGELVVSAARQIARDRFGDF
nr:IclR family transcriptional regulator [Kibdelosporangium sp. MJ126-NF4]